MNASHAQIADLAEVIARRARNIENGRYPHPEAAEALLADCAAHGSETLANQHVNPPIPACVGEDTPGPCFWDATHRGNGLGRSFVRDAEGNVSYR